MAAILPRPAVTRPNTRPLPRAAATTRSAPARRSGFPAVWCRWAADGGGCLRSCLVALFIFVVVPVIIIGILAFGRFSFGPLDLVMQISAGRRWPQGCRVHAATGRESERPTAYDVSVTVPRSWFPAVSQNQWWVMGRDLLDDFVVLAETRASWRDLGVDLDSATPSTAINIVELNPFRLRDAGSPLLLTFGGITTADTTSCDAPDAELVRRGALCGRRSQATEQVTETIFRDYAPPTEIRVINFSVPVAENLVANWTIELPADLWRVRRRHRAHHRQRAGRAALEGVRRFGRESPYPPPLPPK